MVCALKHPKFVIRWLVTHTKEGKSIGLLVSLTSEYRKTPSDESTGESSIYCITVLWECFLRQVWYDCEVKALLTEVFVINISLKSMVKSLNSESKITWIKIENLKTNHHHPPKNQTKPPEKPNPFHILTFSWEERGRPYCNSKIKSVWSLSNRLSSGLCQESW